MKHFLYLICLAIGFSVSGQVKFSGKISDESSGEGLIFVELRIESAEMSVNNMTDENGDFMYEDLPVGLYDFIVIYNFDTVYSERIDLKTDLNQSFKIKLNESIELEEAVLKAKVFRKKSDRFIYDVAASPVAKGNDAFQLLKETPLVSSTDDKSLKILGKSNAIIYINNKKSNMDTEAILEMLKNTQAEQIQRIEIITVPGSEFNIEGNDAIINIIMKKDMTDGYNGRIQLNDSQGYYNNLGGNTGLNFRKNKWAVNTNFYLSGYREREKFVLSNGNDENLTESNGGVIDPNTNVGGSLNLDYEIDSKQSIGFNYNLRYNKSFGSRINMYNSYNGVLSNQSVQHEDAQTRNHSFNLNYEIKTDTIGSKFSTNVSYLWYNRNSESVSETFPINDGAYESFRQFVPQKINNIGANADYIWKTKNENTWSFGGNYNYTQTDNDTRRDDLKEGIYENNFVLSNHFKYKENIIGLYVNFERQFNEKFSGKLGIRYEKTQTEGDILGKDNAFTNDYNNLLPFLNLNYTISPLHNLAFSFSSRVRRPAFWELNPSRMYFTPTNYIQNNPFMLSSKFYNSELTYMFKGAYFLMLGYNYTEDASSQLPLQGRVVEDATGIETDFLRYIRTNYGDQQQFSLTIGMNKEFFEGIWSTNYSVNGFYEKFTGTVTEDPTYMPTPGFTETLYHYVVDSDNFGLLLEANNTIRLSAKKDWHLGVNYWFLAPKQIEFGRLDKIQSLDLSLKKTWNNWTFLLEGRDLFNSNFERIKGTQPDGSFNNVKSHNYRRQLNLKITYTFGNQKLKKAREVDAANSSIKSRT